MCVSQITMTTGWLLLLVVVVVSSQSVDSQSTTGDEVYGEQLRVFKEDMKTLLQTMIAAMRNGVKRDMADILQQHENQTAMSRLGKL